ncbi:hypothetical protein JHK87_018376 [Glycine soja]|nr:hypothetical protein JHK87_018376 [Glycine soja]
MHNFTKHHPSATKLKSGVSQVIEIGYEGNRENSSNVGIITSWSPFKTPASSNLSTQFLGHIDYSEMQNMFLPTMPSTQEEQISLKLLVYKKTNKVILAEAGKDFVDVLFCFLTMPLGTIARLVQTSDLGPGGVGCLSSLYGSVTNLQEYLFTVT